MNQEQGLTDRMMDLARNYASISDPREKYKAESQICRIADRFGFRENLMLYGNNGQAYVPTIERFTTESKFCGAITPTEYRIPVLKRVITQEQKQAIMNQLASEHPECGELGLIPYLVETLDKKRLFVDPDN